MIRFFHFCENNNQQNLIFYDYIIYTYVENKNIYHWMNLKNYFIEFIKSLLSSDFEEDESLIIENYTILIRSYLLKDTS